MNNSSLSKKRSASINIKRKKALDGAPAIDYFDTPCGLWSLENCPFDCQSCEYCEKVLTPNIGKDKQG